MAILNWCYGAKAPTQNASMVDQQIWLAHRYKNKLIEIDNARRQKASLSAMSLYPQFDVAMKSYSAACVVLDAAYAAVKAARSKAKKRIDATDEQQAAIDAAKASRKSAAKNMQEHKSTAWKILAEAQKPYRDIAESVTEIPDGATDTHRKKLIRDRYLQMLEDAGLSSGEQEHSIAVKRERNKCGCYWGTYLIVEDAMKDIHKGAPAKFRRFEGDGSIAVQLQGGLTYVDAIAGTDTRLRLYLPKLTERMAVTGCDSGLDAVGEAWIRIGTENNKPVWSVVPFCYHREIPPDAVIKWAFIDRKRVGLHDHHTLRLTIATTMDRHATDATAKCAIHCGHRMVSGGLRVATALTDTGIQELIIPSDEVDRFAESYNLVAIRDSVSHDVYAEFVDWIRTIKANEWFDTQTETIAHWQGANRLNRLVRLWRDNRFEADSESASHMPETLSWAMSKLSEYNATSGYHPVNPDDLSTVYGLMEFWRRFDKHLLEWAANSKRKCGKRREQLFRGFVKNLRRENKTAVIAKIDWAKLREKPDTDEDDDVCTNIRRLAGVASPGRLSEILKEVFGGDCVSVASKDITRECSECGKLHEFDRMKIVTTCRHCGAEYDQDHNAVRNTMARGDVVSQKKQENAGKNNEEMEKKKSARKVRRNRKSV